MSKDRAEPIASNIERLMAESDREPPWNPRSLALAAGINEWGVRDILSGRSLNPQFSTIAKIAKALDVPPERITGQAKAVHPELQAEVADLSDEERRAVLAYIRHLRSTRAA